MPSKEHIGFSIFAHFQLNEYVIHFVYIQQCNGSFLSFSQKREWTQYAFYDDTGFWSRNHRISMSTALLHVYFRLFSILATTFVFEIDFSSSCKVIRQLYDEYLAWTNRVRSGPVRFVRFTYCKLHNLQSKLLKQSWPIYRSEFNLCIANYKHSFRSDAQLNFHVLIYSEKKNKRWIIEVNSNK